MFKLNLCKKEDFVNIVTDDQGIFEDYDDIICEAYEADYIDIGTKLWDQIETEDYGKIREIDNAFFQYFRTEDKLILFITFDTVLIGEGPTGNENGYMYYSNGFTRVKPAFILNLVRQIKNKDFE